MDASAEHEIAELLGRLRVPAAAEAAMERLAQLGEPAVAPLVTLLGEDDAPDEVREGAAIALAWIDPAGVQRLLAMLAAENDELADLAAWALRWPPRSGQAEPILVGMLGSPSAARRRRAARGLKYIGPDLSTLDQRVLAALADTDPAVRRDVVEAVRRSGQSSASVLLALDGAASDDDAGVAPATP